MNRFTYTILLFTCILVSCNSDKPTEEQERLRIEARDVSKNAVKSSRERDNWEALSLWNRADELYSEADVDDDLKYRYLIHRQKATILNRLKFYNLASQSMQEALKFLKGAPNLPKGYDAYKEEISTTRYLGTYIRHKGEYLESNEVLLPLIDYDNEKVPGLNAQVKNLIGLNFYDLKDYENAFVHFNDILKISDLDPKLKAHYLINRGRSQYKRGNKLQAFNDMSEALGINQALGRDLYTFINYMEIGDMYLYEGENQRANENLDKALSIYCNIDSDPDLFKIYNLKFSAANALGLEDAVSYKMKFDELTEVHSDNRVKYTTQQELALYTAGIGLFTYNLTHDYLWYRDSNLLLVISLLVVALSIVFWPKKIVNTSILKQAKSNSRY